MATDAVSQAEAEDGSGDVYMKTVPVLICGLTLVALAVGYGYREDLHAALSPSDGKKLAQTADQPKPDAKARKGRKRGPQQVPVLAAKVVEKELPRRLTAIGSAQAFATVAVKSRVDGQITEAFFKAGQTVAQGDLLFRIDPRPFQVALRLAQANLERDRAQATKAQGDVTRYKSLVGKGYTSQQKYEEARATFDALKAVQKADEAAIEAAKLQLDYTSIRSPIDGRTGNMLVDTGNLIKANDAGPLVVITQLRPIYVTFSVPERYLARIKRLMAAGNVPVEARLPGTDSASARGHLVFINNAVDTNTGTIQLKAEFENAGTDLTDGQFVNVALTLENRPTALVVPSQALQDGQHGSFVFVVKENSTVEMRNVVADDTVGDVTVITKGLAAGETLVLDGQLLLRPGSRVSLKSAAGDPPAARSGGDGERRKKRRMKEGS